MPYYGYPGSVMPLHTRWKAMKKKKEAVHRLICQRTNPKLTSASPPPKKKNCNGKTTIPCHREKDYCLMAEQVCLTFAEEDYLLTAKQAYLIIVKKILCHSQKKLP